MDAAEGATFPYAWYFRHLASGYIDYQQANAAAPTSDVLILTEPARPGWRRRASHGYDGRQFDFRVWWVREYDTHDPPRQPFRYITQRKIWNPTGGMKEWLCIKK